MGQGPGGQDQSQGLREVLDGLRQVTNGLQVVLDNWDAGVVELRQVRDAGRARGLSDDEFRRAEDAGPELAQARVRAERRCQPRIRAVAG
jgi:hypothetical protein